jgi:hypothetical protein
MDGRMDGWKEEQSGKAWQLQAAAPVQSISSALNLLNIGMGL